MCRTPSHINMQCQDSRLTDRQPWITAGCAVVEIFVITPCLAWFKWVQTSYASVRSFSPHCTVYVKTYWYHWRVALCILVQKLLEKRKKKDLHAKRGHVKGWVRASPPAWQNAVDLELANCRGIRFARRVVGRASAMAC